MKRFAATTGFLCLLTTVGTCSMLPDSVGRFTSDLATRAAPGIPINAPRTRPVMTKYSISENTNHDRAMNTNTQVTGIRGDRPLTGLSLSASALSEAQRLATCSPAPCAPAPGRVQASRADTGISSRSILGTRDVTGPVADAEQSSSLPVAWTTSSLVRTGKTDAAGTSTQAMISAGRGEYESFQVAVQAPAGGLTNVNFSVSALSGPGGATIPQSSFSLFREQYVYVNKSSPDWEGSNRPMGTGWYPDGLIPFNDPSTGRPITGARLEAVPFNLTAANNQPIWVDVLVPRDAAPGQYLGNWTVTSDQGNVTGSIVLTVWNFTLPLQSSLKSAFLFWNTSSLAADQELLRNKIEPLFTDVSIQSSLMTNYGLSTVGLSYWSGADNSTCTMSAAPSVADLKAAAAAQQPGLMPILYSADEITFCPSLNAQVKEWARNIHAAGINNLVTIAPNPLLFDDGSGSGRSAVDIWTMLPVSWESSAANVSAAIAKGDSVWSYNTVVQDSYSPKWEIDF